MFGRYRIVPRGVLTSLPPKMLGREDAREPSGKVVSKPPKMLGLDEETRPPGASTQSSPPKMFGRHETSPAGPSATSPRARTGTTSRESARIVMAPAQHSRRRRVTRLLFPFLPREGGLCAVCHRPFRRRHLGVAHAVVRAVKKNEPVKPRCEECRAKEREAPGFMTSAAPLASAGGAR